MLSQFESEFISPALRDARSPLGLRCPERCSARWTLGAVPPLQKGCGALLIAGLLALLLIDAAAAQPSAETAAEIRAAVPGEAAIKPAVAEIHALFKNEFAKAKKPADKIALAEKLLAMAGESEAAVERYALLGEVRSLAFAAAQPALMVQAVSALSEAFAVDRLAELTAAVEECGGKEWPLAARKELVEQITPLVDEAIAAREFKLARRLATVGLAATRKTNQSAEGKNFAAQVKEAAGLEKLAEETGAARKKLALTPDDPAANAAVGKYLCLSLGKWKAGLPHLAKGNDELLRAAAERDLAAPTATTELVKAGDAWWAAAEKQSPRGKKLAQARAGFWYRQAIGDLGGLNQIKLQKRLDELPEEAIDHASTAETQPSSKPVEPVLGGKSMFLSELEPRDVHLFPGVRWSDPVKFDGAPSPHGLQAHPDAQGFARLVYDLPPKFRTLQGSVAIDDFMAGAGGSNRPIEFRIVGDGKELWKSQPIQKCKESEKFSADITGVKQLELFADCPSTWGAHSVWLEPQLFAAGMPAKKSSKAPPTSKTVPAKAKPARP
jgi:hypothetical protein